MSPKTISGVRPSICVPMSNSLRGILWRSRDAVKWSLLVPSLLTFAIPYYFHCPTPQIIVQCGLMQWMIISSQLDIILSFTQPLEHSQCLLSLITYSPQNKSCSHWSYTFIIIFSALITHQFFKSQISFNLSQLHDLPLVSPLCDCTGWSFPCDFQPWL